MTPPHGQLLGVLHPADVDPPVAVELPELARRGPRQHVPVVHLERGCLLGPGRPHPVPLAVVHPGRVVDEAPLAVAKVEGEVEEAVLDGEEQVVGRGGEAVAASPQHQAVRRDHLQAEADGVARAKDAGEKKEIVVLFRTVF